MMVKKKFNKIIPFIVSLSFFMEAVDTTIINTAIPAMSRSLEVNPVSLKVALISYLLSLAIFIPISGWIADRFGIKKTFLMALGIFTISSMACGFANNLPELVIARFIQGMGGALGLPVGRLILLRTFPREYFISMMTQVVMIGALGMMLGPVIGGVITHYYSWHWIFWVNVPIGIFSIGLANRYLQNYESETVYALDKIGFILFGASLAGFSFGLSMLSETTIPPWISLTVLLVSIMLLVVYAMHSRTKLHPIVKTELLHIRTFRISVTGNLFSRLGFGGIPFLIPLFLQIILGYSPELSGLLLAPTAIGIFLSKSLTLLVLRILAYKRLLILNTVLAGLAIWAFSIVTVHTPIYVIALLTFIYGFLLSLQYSAMNSLAYADLSSNDFSAANSIMSTLQQLAQSFGVAVSALCIRLFTSFFSDHMILTTQIFHFTFFAMGFITLGSSVIFFQLKENDGQQMLNKSEISKESSDL